ncbi:helix-turn-helix domain-containing protein [Streptomyces cadmiisoli]|uniref:helix-turn-helix domain-containing protein n=1 Tax=Streptomyces cadmiisoli TaxID=2184053 RepID=UPI003649F209
MRSLTIRQRQVLTLAAFGYTNAQIGRLLNVRANTINRHLSEVYATLGARDRANAVAIGIHSGDITLSELGRIAAAATDRPTDGPSEPPRARLSAPEPVSGLPEGRDADRPPQSRTDAAA